MTFKSCLSHINHGDKNDHDEDIVTWTPALDKAILQDLSPCLQLIAHLGQDQSLVLPPLLPAATTTNTHLKLFSLLWIYIVKRACWHASYNWLPVYWWQHSLGSCCHNANSLKSNPIGHLLPLKSKSLFVARFLLRLGLALPTVCWQKTQLRGQIITLIFQSHQ